MLRKIKNSKSAIFALILLVAALMAAIYFFWYKPHNAQKAEAAAGAGFSAVEVSVVQVTKQEIQQSLELPGRVEAYKIAQIRPQVSGIIKNIKFEEGSFVQKGRQLYQIDPAIYESDYESAQANFATLNLKKKRYKNLLDQDAVSKQEYEDVALAFDNAKAELKRSKANFEYTKVLAPISGYIGKSNVTEGGLVNANQAEVLTTITQLDPIYVDMVQPVEDNIKLGNQRGITVEIITEDGSYQDRGTLKFSEVFADESTDSVRLRAVFSNNEKKLFPGMFVNAKLSLKPLEVVTVPQRATNRGPDGNLTVFVVEADNVVKLRPITASEIYGDSWIVTSGLEEGETIVYEGSQKIMDGAKVTTVSANIVKSEELTN